MRTFIMLTAGAATALCLASTVTADTITFIADDGDCNCQGFWDIGSSWQGGFPPGEDDIALIPSGKQARIRPDVTIDPVQAVVIEEDGATDDTWVRLDQGGTNKAILELLGTASSEIDGTLQMQDETILQINGDTTIFGTGRIEVGEDAVIRDNGSGYVLTLTDSGACSGTLTRDCAPEILSEDGGIVEVELENDAFVVARGPALTPPQSCDLPTSGHLKLADEDKAGDGYWVAEYGGGLEVDAHITGSAGWLINETGNTCTAFLIDACVGSTGDVSLTNGNLIVRDEGQAHFCTQGDLGSAGHLGGDGTSADLIVADGRQAKFGNDECNCVGGE